MGAILLDTCVLRHCLSKQARERTPSLVARLTAELADGAHVSTLTVYELDRWLQLLHLRGGGGQKARIVAMLLAETTVHEMAPQIWRLAALMHAQAATQNVTFGEADLLILATAIVHGVRVLTTDVAFAQNAGECWRCRFDRVSNTRVVAHRLRQ